MSDKKKVFVSYIDDNGTKKEGYFDSVEETASGSLIISSKENKFRIPQGRWMKIKEGR